MFEADFCAAEIFSEIDVDRALAAVLFYGYRWRHRARHATSRLEQTFKTDVELEQVAVDGLAHAMISSADGKSKTTSHVCFNRARIAREQQSPW